jgi:transcriptional regulator with XRE-family HTH domain
MPMSHAPFRSDILRERLRAIVTRDFGGNQTAAAKVLGISASAINQIVHGTKEGGLPTLLAVANFEECSVDELLGRVPSAPRTTSDFPQALTQAMNAMRLRGATVAAVRTHLRETHCDYSAPQWRALIDGLERELGYAELRDLAEKTATKPVRTERPAAEAPPSPGSRPRGRRKASA